MELICPLSSSWVVSLKNQLRSSMWKHLTRHFKMKWFLKHSRMTQNIMLYMYMLLLLNEPAELENIHRPCPHATQCLQVWVKVMSSGRLCCFSKLRNFCPSTFFPAKKFLLFLFVFGFISEPFLVSQLPTINQWGHFQVPLCLYICLLIKLRWNLLPLAWPQQLGKHLRNLPSL